MKKGGRGYTWTVYKEVTAPEGFAAKLKHLLGSNRNWQFKNPVCVPYSHWERTSIFHWPVSGQVIHILANLPIPSLTLIRCYFDGL